VSIWKILYSPYDIGALIITVIGLALHALADYLRRRRGGSGR